MDVLLKETCIKKKSNDDSTNVIRQEESFNERPSSAINAFQTKFSSSEVESVESLLKDTDIILLRENFNRRIFHQEQSYEHIIDKDRYQCAVHIGTLQWPICVTELDTFDEYQSYMKTCENKRICLIIPTALNTTRLEMIQKNPQIFVIYELDSENIWTAMEFNGDSFPFKNLLSQLKQLFSWIDNDEITLHPLREQAIDTSLKDIDNDSRMFIIYQLLVEIILKSPRSEMSIRNFIDYAHQIFSNKGRFENDIKEFSSNFAPNKAIYWYTRPSFVYRLLSRTCCLNNIQNIFEIRYFICNLFDQLKTLHEESLSKFGKNLEVYRGKVVTNDEFLKMKKSIGNLVITKNFLSTTINRKVAVQFAGDNLPKGKVGVIFHMIIDTKVNQTKPFAYVASKSCIPNENEVLLSIGTVFKTVSINEVTETLKEVVLKRDDEEERLERSIFDRYFPANSDNEGNNVDLVLEFLQTHKNEESNREFIQLILDHLCSFDSTTTGKNRGIETASFIPKVTAEAPVLVATATTRSDSSEWYTIECGPSQYTLPIRYQALSPIGQGTFGTVIRATDKDTDKPVAIKKLRYSFQNTTHAKRVYRELKLLMYLNHPDAQVVQLYNVFTPETNVNNFQTLYFVLNFADYNLSEVIRRGKPFTEHHIKLLIYSLLRGLKYMHSAGVIHRDLKPTNIGIDQYLNLTILGFGLARIATSGLQTGYIATRWWRAPEIFLNWEHYNEKVDIWPVGCMMAELILLKPLFPGADHIDQLTKILDIVGTPDLETLKEICQRSAYDFIREHYPAKPKKNYQELFGCKYESSSGAIISGVSPQGIALLDRLLSFDHRKRPSAVEALSDPYFEDLHDPMDEPSIEPLHDEHQDASHSIEHWKSIIWKMIEDFQPPSWASKDDDDDI